MSLKVQSTSKVSTCCIATTSTLTLFMVQKAVITNLLNNYASNYQFLLDAEGSMILPYIVVSRLGPASTNRTCVTYKIPLPAGLNKTSTDQASTAISWFRDSNHTRQQLSSCLIGRWFAPLLQACALSLALCYTKYV